MATNHRLLALMIVLLLALPASALSYLRCVKAASSSDGRFLVVSDTQMEPVKGEPYAYKITRLTLQIFSEEKFGIPGEKPPSLPMTFWLDSPALWTVVLGDDKAQPCPLPLLSDAAEYLVLLGQQEGFDPHNVVMRIYKEPSRTGPPSEWGHGVLVKELTLKDLWPGRKFSDAPVTNGAPLWFERGTFQWGRDNHSLLHKTASGESVSVDLDTGFVTDCTKQTVYTCEGY
jgi:hypothetical protein